MVWRFGVHGRGWPGRGVGLARHETRSSSVVGRMYGWREPTSSRRRRSLHAHGQREEPAPCFGSCLVGGFGWNSLLGDRAPVEESSAASKTIRSTATRPKIMIDAYIYLSLFACISAPIRSNIVPVDHVPKSTRVVRRRGRLNRYVLFQGSLVCI